MKVNKHGDFIKKRTHRFKCSNCDCKYTAGNGEWGFCDEYGDPKTYPTEYVSCQCPECRKLNYIQWRGKFRDWWDENWDWVLFFVGLLLLVLFIVFVEIRHYGLGFISLILSVILIPLSIEHIKQ